MPTTFGPLWTLLHIFPGPRLSTDCRLLSLDYKSLWVAWLAGPKNVKATICLKCMVLLWASLFHVTSSLWHPLILPPHRPLRDACGPPLSLCQYPSTSVPDCVCVRACVWVCERERECVCAQWTGATGLSQVYVEESTLTYECMRACVCMFCEWMCR